MSLSFLVKMFLITHWGLSLLEEHLQCPSLLVVVQDQTGTIFRCKRQIWRKPRILKTIKCIINPWCVYVRHSVFKCQIVAVNAAVSVEQTYISVSDNKIFSGITGFSRPTYFTLSLTTPFSSVMWIFTRMNLSSMFYFWKWLRFLWNDEYSLLPFFKFIC